MNRSSILMAGLLFGVLSWTQDASAQYPGSRPTVSPYLNLLTADQLGITGGYQTLVKPFVDQRVASQQNQAAIQRLQTQVSRGAVGGARPRSSAHAGSQLGLRSYYQNYDHFYNLQATGVRRPAPAGP